MPIRRTPADDPDYDGTQPQPAPGLGVPGDQRNPNPVPEPPAPTTLPTWRRDYGPYYAESTGQAYEGTPQDWLRSTINSGISPQDAIGQFNSFWHAQKGNEATYYGQDAGHKYATIGLPEGYFTQEGGKQWPTGLTEWNWVNRMPEGPGMTTPPVQRRGPIDSSTFAPPPVPGGAGNVGQDDFSKLVTGKLGELISNNGHLNAGTEALDLENTRQAADRARKAEYEGAMSQLAARGLLPENVQGGQGGLALDALGRIERNDIAPLFSNATRDYQIHKADLANSNLMGALGQATNRQGVLGNLALQTLAQNTQFNEFLARFGLDRDKVLADLSMGQNSQLIDLLLAHLHGTDISAGGFV